MSPMNFEHNQALYDLVAEYEAMTQQGAVGYLEEKSFFQLIEYYEKEEQLDRALEVVDYAIKAYSYSADLYIRKAQLLIDMGQEELALKALDQAAVFAPSEMDINLLRAEAFAYLGMADEALAILDLLKDQIEGEDLSEIYFIEALVYDSLEQTEQMFYALKAALKDNPNHKEALDRLWLCIEITKKYEESVVMFEEFIDADPYSHLAWYYLGHACSYLGDYERAIESYEYAFIINEKFDPAYKDCAEVCYETKQYGRALKCYDELMEHFEADSDLLLRIGQCHQQLGRFKQARVYFSQAASMDPHDDEVIFYIGECYAGEKRWETAVRFYKKAIYLEDSREEYYAALAKAYQEIGQPEKTKDSFERAIEIAPEESEYWVKYACFLMESGEGEEAIELLDDAEFSAVGAELTYCRTACLLFLGRRKEALYWLGEALQDDFAKFPCLFDYLPELKNDPDVIALISMYQEEQ